MEIDFAASNVSDPDEWVIKPKTVKQWDDLKNETS